MTSKEAIKSKIAERASSSKTPISKIRAKVGMSNAGKYPNVAKKDFAGPKGTFPINSEARGRNALARAHFSPHPEEIKSKVYSKFPGLKKRHDERSKG